jgi:pimeloyl-ACP methyl ester carboxylesterase
MPVLDRDGVRIAYKIHGAAGGASPLLLTHGYGASGSMWAANVAALAADRPVITWDLRGHGASDAPHDPARYAQEACVEDIAALLDAAGAEQAVLGGMSLGGYVSLLFHLRHRERVLALVLVDTGPGFRDDAARERWNEWARGRADALERDGLAALLGGREQAQAHHRHGARGLAHAARGMLVQHRGPVFEVGAEDANFLAAAEVMAARIPGARKVVLAEAGHAANMDAPEPFNAAVREFLETAWEPR